MFKILFILLAAYLGIFIFFRFYYFFRNPKRIIPSGNNVVAPADGKVIYVQKVSRGQVPLAIKGHPIRLDEILGLKDFQDQEGYLLGIFLSPLNVHRNRAPVSGRVVKRHYVKAPGNISMVKIGFTTFLGLKPYERDSEYIVKNERNTIVLQGERFPVAVTQIADAWVNRIVCYVKEGDYLPKGEEFGLIRMGSQVDLFLPVQDSLIIHVSPGDKVYAGETILASF